MNYRICPVAAPGVDDCAGQVVLPEWHMNVVFNPLICSKQRSVRRVVIDSSGVDANKSDDMGFDRPAVCNRDGALEGDVFW